MVRGFPVVILVCVACGPDAEVAQEPGRATVEDAVATICEYREACDCGLSRSRCVHELGAQLDVALAMAADQGRRIEPKCVERYLDLFPTVGCRTDADFDEAYVESIIEQFYDAILCDVFEGSAELGEPCSRDPVLGDPCRPGAVCHRGVCIEPIEFAALGDPCTDAYPFSCEGDLECADVEGNEVFVCVAPVAEGEPCVGPSLYCGRDRECRGARCVPYPDLGEGCLNRCRGEASCSDGVCVAPPGEGQPCGVTCADGFDCDPETRTCVPEPPFACEMQFFGSTEGA